MNRWLNNSCGSGTIASALVRSQVRRDHREPGLRLFPGFPVHPDFTLLAGFEMMGTLGLR